MGGFSRCSAKTRAWQRLQQLKDWAASPWATRSQRSSKTHSGWPAPRVSASVRNRPDSCCFCMSAVRNRALRHDGALSAPESAVSRASSSNSLWSRSLGRLLLIPPLLELLPGASEKPLNGLFRSSGLHSNVAKAPVFLIPLQQDHAVGFRQNR